MFSGKLQLYGVVGNYIYVCFVSLKHTNPNQVYFVSLDIRYSEKCEHSDLHMPFSDTTSNTILALSSSEFYSILLVFCILQAQRQTQTLNFHSKYSSLSVLQHAMLSYCLTLPSA
jgi:hypothetical protein